jgi:transposase
VLQALSIDRDLAEVMLDSTAVRAHQHAAGAQKNTAPALGRSRGGFGTQIHGIVDALDHLIGFTLTGAEQADITPALALLDHAPGARAVIADKGYDADARVACIEGRQAEAFIPPRSNRNAP